MSDRGTNAGTNEPSKLTPHTQLTNRFRFFPQLNDLSDQRWLRSSAKLSEKAAASHFGSDSLQDTLIRAIADQRGLSIKEVMETFEFFSRVRKTIKAECVADLCCGHGLQARRRSRLVTPGLFNRQRPRLRRFIGPLHRHRHQQTGPTSNPTLLLPKIRL